MKYLLIFFIIFLCGCALGRPSKANGRAAFFIPFEFPGQKESMVQQDNVITQDLFKLEAEMIKEKQLQQPEESQL